MRLSVLFALLPLPYLAAAEPFQTATTEKPSQPNLISRAGNWFDSDDSAVKLQLALQEEVLGNVSGGFRRGTIYEALLQPGIAIDFDKLFCWKGLTFEANIEYAYGSSPTSKLVHDLNGLSNIDAYDSPRLNEVWFQQTLFDEKLSIRVGLLAADTEFMVVDSGAVFLNSCFGAPPTLGLNVPDSPTYPFTAPGLRIAWSPNDQWTVRVGAYSGDVGTQDGDNKQGMRFAFDSAGGALVLGEIVHSPKFDTPWGKLPAVIKVGGYYDTGDFPDLRHSDSVISHNLGGVYASWDQGLYRVPSLGTSDKGGDKGSGKAVTPPETRCQGAKPPAPDKYRGLNAYVRLSYAGPEERAIVSYYAEAGLTYKGLFDGHEDDILGLAFSDSQVSAEAEFLSGIPVTAHHETLIEATYQAVINQHLSIQPDLQVIFNPGGAIHASTAVVVGVRWAITF